MSVEEIPYCSILLLRIDALRAPVMYLQAIREEIERVNLEVQQAERDYDLNRAAGVGVGERGGGMP